MGQYGVMGFNNNMKPDNHNFEPTNIGVDVEGFTYYACTRCGMEAMRFRDAPYMKVKDIVLECVEEETEVPTIMLDF